MDLPWFSTIFVFIHQVFFPSLKRAEFLSKLNKKLKHVQLEIMTEHET